MMVAVDCFEDSAGEWSSLRVCVRLKMRSLCVHETQSDINIYRCRRCGVERFFSILDEVVGVTTWAEDAEANESDRMVDGVDDAVESNELRNCCVEERETVRSDSFLLIFEFCSLAIYTARKQKSIDEHSSSASFRSFRRKMISSTVEAWSLVETRSNPFAVKEKPVTISWITYHIS